MILDEAYKQLEGLGLTTSHNDFSRKWLNKSTRYMSMLRASGREPSVDALARFLANLRLHYKAYSNSRLSQTQSRAAMIKPILDRVNTALLVSAEAKTLNRPW